MYLIFPVHPRYPYLLEIHCIFISLVQLRLWLLKFKFLNLLFQWQVCYSSSCRLILTVILGNTKVILGNRDWQTLNHYTSAILHRIEQMQIYNNIFIQCFIEYNSTNTIIPITVFDSLSKSWANDVSLWKFSPLAFYLFVPKFSWWYLYLRSSSEPQQERKVSLWESQAQTLGELIYLTHQCFISPQTSHFHCLQGPTESLVDFLSLLCFYEHFYASGKLLWNIFSICLAVVLYLLVFVLYSISLIFDSYLFCS